ncbi:MAG: ATP-binding protein [Kiritimatiellae bacterium]|nr:ATP-binding protein [Kiritimatiellia bacterium]
MQRDIFQKIIDWNSSSKRKPLILMGARQVGKTWLMNEFASEFYPDSHVKVDLQRDDLLRARIDESNIDPKTMIDLIQAATGKQIVPGKTLLIIDEIQESHKALNALKYFNQEMPELAIIVAGSLLGLAVGKSDDARQRKKHKAQGSFPVGKVSFLDVHPMSFSEFVRAVDNPFRLKALETGDWKLVETLKEDFESLLRKYLFVGGMPEAVADFAKTGDYTAVRKTQDEILAAYDADFVKHAPPELLHKIRLLWQNIPAQLAKENKKFIYTALKSGARAREYETALSWLDDAGMVNQVFRASPPRLPLASYQDFSAFKLYMHDVGLLGAMSGTSSSMLLDGNDLFTNFKGALAEQFVLQELAANGIEPSYWTSDSGNAEVEFVIQGENDVFPVEAKAGINTKAKSLKVYRELFNPPYAIRTSLQPYHDGEAVKDIPLYAFGIHVSQLLSPTRCRGRVYTPATSGCWPRA